MADDLAQDEIHVWYRHTESLDHLADDLAEVTLSDGEKDRRRRFLFSRDRRDYAAAHDLLRRSLSRYAPVDPTEWQFAASQNGKPFIDETIAGKAVRPLYFNLSHTRRLVACAIGFDMQVGVDVERADRAIDVEQLAARYFSRSEIIKLEQCNADLRVGRFLDFWTLKEAFLKANGVGLSQPLNSLAFDFSPAGTICFVSATDVVASNWRFALYSPTVDSRLAVAVCARERRDVRFSVRNVDTSVHLVSVARTV